MSRELRVHSVPTRAEQIRTIVEIVAIVLAGIWALYTFVYEQRIKPLSEAPAFALPTVIDQGPTVNGVVFLTIHKRLENNGNIPIDIAAEAMSVYGETVDPKHQRSTLTQTPTHTELRADVPRKVGKVLWAFAKLRIGAVGGDPRTAFFLPAHSSSEEQFLVTVPAHKYSAVLVTRTDYLAKAPIEPKMLVRIVRAPLGGYDLKSESLEGEYDTQLEYPIKP